MNTEDEFYSLLMDPLFNLTEGFMKDIQDLKTGILSSSDQKTEFIKSMHACLTHYKEYQHKIYEIDSHEHLSHVSNFSCYSLHITGSVFKAI